MLEVQVICLAVFLASPKAGSSMAAKMEMIPITTRSSISVKFHGLTRFESDGEVAPSHAVYINPTDFRRHRTTVDFRHDILPLLHIVLM